MKYTFVDRKNVLVITPTVVRNTLRDCCESVTNQTYEVDHLLVTDGIDDVREESLNIMFEKGYIRRSKTKVLNLPWNVGKDGGSWYGHRVYASVPKLIPQKYDYIMFLDEDNFFQPEHVETCVEMMDNNPQLHFCYSLRRVVDINGKFLIDDNCESLGKWPVYVDPKGENFLVDTSSYCFRRDFIRSACHVWDHGWGGDRRFFHAVKDQTNHDNTGKYTLNYRLDGNEGSVNKSFFDNGNLVMKEKYGTYPWSKE